jgi:excisionase family DNA binding protein
MVSGYLTVASVAEDLDVSARTVLRWVERGDLAAVRLPGGRLRIAEADLTAALERWATTPRRMLASVGDGEA